MTDEDKWINVDPRSGKLVIRFRVKGFPKRQFFIATGLKDTKRHREIVRSRRDAIATDIALQRFDPSLEGYQFTGSKEIRLPDEPKKPEAKYRYDLQELWEKYTNFQSAQLEKTTILSSYQAIARYIHRLPNAGLENASDIRDWLLVNTTQYMAWDNLTSYKRCCEWAVDSGLISDNPFAKLKIQKPKRKSDDDDDYRAFTLEQRDLIIKAFEQHRVHSYYAPLVKFLFWTGCRLGEAFALTWGDINDDCRKISISKSRNLYKILKGTKNRKKRVFPAQQGSKLQELLLNLRPENCNPNHLVFVSKTGKCLSSDTASNFWNEVISCYNGKLYYYPGVVKELVQQGKIPYYLKPYSTRHTFTTWAISSGISPDKVALWIGDEVETVLRHYCHPNVVNSECPDF
jgi:integrase